MAGTVKVDLTKEEQDKAFVSVSELSERMNAESVLIVIGKPAGNTKQEVRREWTWGEVKKGLAPHIVVQDWMTKSHRSWDSPGEPVVYEFTVAKKDWSRAKDWMAGL